MCPGSSLLVIVEKYNWCLYCSRWLKNIGLFPMDLPMPLFVIVENYDVVPLLQSVAQKIQVFPDGSAHAYVMLYLMAWSSKLM